jgi:alkylation response protein AidB-like acyl-CoA dehydrogenase
VGSANKAFALGLMLTQGAIDMLGEFAEERFKEQLLPHLVSAAWSGTMNLTEPQAGSDVGALTTRAVRQPDGTYRITGQKIFITYGEHDLTDNIVHLVLARVPDAPPGTKGISCFIVPKNLLADDGSIGARNDVRCVSIEHKLGIHASPTCVMSYGDEGGAVGYLIGEENAGMRYMFRMMNNARLSVGLEGLAISERAYQHALAYAQERLQGRAPGAPAGTSSPIIEHPDVRRMLLTMRASIARCATCSTPTEAVMRRARTRQAARSLARELVELLTPISKAWCTDLGVQIASLSPQVHGGMGCIEETGAAQYYRDARISPSTRARTASRPSISSGASSPCAGAAWWRITSRASPRSMPTSPPRPRSARRPATPRRSPRSAPSSQPGARRSSSPPRGSPNTAPGIPRRRSRARPRTSRCSSTGGWLPRPPWRRGRSERW